MNEESGELREQFHALISLSHVPPNDVLSAFDLISDNYLDELDVVTRLKGGRHERGFGLFLKELNMDSLNRRLESYCLQTTEALAY